jgi:pilus assembly protein CpaE
MTAMTTIAAGARLARRRMALTSDPAATTALAAAFEVLGWEAVELASSGLLGAAAAIASGQPPTLLICDIDGIADPLAALADLAEVCLAETQVLAIGSRDDVGLFRALLAAGVGDYLVKPLQSDILATALAAIEPAAPAVATTGRIIAVMGVRGGCGATTVTTSLAWTIAEADDRLDRQRRCILVDLDLHFGSAALALGLEPSTGLAAMLANPDRLDEQLIAANLQPVGDHFDDRLAIMATQTPIEQEALVSAPAAAALLSALGTAASFVIVDLPRNLDPAARQLLRLADTVILVASPSLEGLRDTGRLLTWLLALRAGASPLVVVNGAAGGAGEVSRRLFEDTIGAPVTAWIPALHGPAAAAAAHGMPLAALTSDKLDRAGNSSNPFAALAAAVTGDAVPTRRSRLPRWWPGQ